MSDVTCAKCGGVIEIGDWPFCPHGKSVQTHAFEAYFDYGLGCEVTSLSQRLSLMRERKLTYRDHMSKGDLSARRDRIEQEKREARR